MYLLKKQASLPERHLAVATSPSLQSRGLLTSSGTASVEIIWNDLLWKWSELGWVAKQLGCEQACPESFRQKRASSLGVPSEAKLCLRFCFGGDDSPLPSNLNSQGFGCHNSSSCSWNAGYWLAGAAVTSDKGSQSEQDLPCLLLQTAEVVINRTASFSLCSELQPGNALSGAKPGGARELKGWSQIRGLYFDPHVEPWIRLPFTQVHFSLSI